METAYPSRLLPSAPSVAVSKSPITSARIVTSLGGETPRAYLTAQMRIALLPSEGLPYEGHRRYHEPSYEFDVEAASRDFC